MIEIRPEQLEMMIKQRMEDFQARAIRHLRKHYPRYCEPLSDAELISLLESSMRSAERYELRSEKAVIVWTELVIRYGNRFDWGVQTSEGTDRWAQYILNHDELNEPGKLERLSGYIVRETDLQ